VGSGDFVGNLWAAVVVCECSILLYPLLYDAVFVFLAEWSTSELILLGDGWTDFGD
jgi:hypothetical protein